MFFCRQEVLTFFHRNWNAGARLWNHSAVQPDSKLSPLFSFVTGELIERCPSTVQELDSVQSGFSVSQSWRRVALTFFLAAVGDVDRLLCHLDEPTHGRADVRRRRLKLAFGVTTRLL